MKITILLVIFLILNSCTMKSQNYTDYQGLRKHRGTENYEVVELYDAEFEIKGNVLFDTFNKNIVLKGFKK